MCVCVYFMKEKKLVIFFSHYSIIEHVSSHFTSSFKKKLKFTSYISTTMINTDKHKIANISLSLSLSISLFLTRSKVFLHFFSSSSRRRVYFLTLILLYKCKIKNWQTILCVHYYYYNYSLIYLFFNDMR
jgi:hypothetical protein